MPERKHDYGLFLKQGVKPLCGLVSVESREVYPLEPEELETPVKRFVKPEPIRTLCYFIFLFYAA